MKDVNRTRLEKLALDSYQNALKRMALILENIEESMVSAGCYWRIRSECSDLIVRVKMCRVSVLCERDKLLESRKVESQVY